MQMKSLLNEWRRFIAEATENNFEHNFEKIYQAAENSPTDTHDFLAKLNFKYLNQIKDKNKYLGQAKDEFKKILLDAGAEKVLKDYKIKSILGSGAIEIGRAHV